ncbi:hypothetical protein DES53_104344 [Roseimicrobium gellanilyticum]|uniref:Uncharacterized protein n=1 Tax=Roseimicrobium gellanilyticum TaxID=748857 RepID=A0A366HNC0_9BACT|nr:hypothetical protein [Roseimicrobium gellanilyticum]RBP44523.1 hypothetical protein DES53_104344 [Roseimicrobium gellanilyticum]
MSDAATPPFAWWRARRIRYNIGLVVAGILAFIAYAAVGFVMLPADAEFEITGLTILFQGFGYLFMIGVANVFYFIGPLSEFVIRPGDPESYRRTCFRLGFWFSVLLPFGIPVLLAVLAVLRSDYWRHSV